MSARPSIHTTLLAVAREMGKRSTCSRASVGAILARDTRIIESGYNGAPAGLPHCNHECTCPDWWTDLEHSADCHSLAPCTTATHAEANAIAAAARHGIALAGATLYVTLAPCLACARLVVAAGVINVYFGTVYRSNEGLELLSLAGIKTYQFQGAPE